MGLFDSYEKKTKINEIDLNEFEAAIFLAYMSYGSKADYEGLEVNVYLSTIKKFYPNRDDFDFDVYVPHFGEIMANNSRDDLIKHCASVINKDHRETVFTFLVDGVLADGHLSGEEEIIIESLQNQFEISNELASKIIEVMIIKNKDISF